MYYKDMYVNGYNFNVTSDGLLLTETYSPGEASYWDALRIASEIFFAIWWIVTDINSGGFEIETIDDARKFTNKAASSIRHFIDYEALRLIDHRLRFLNDMDNDVLIPQDIWLSIQAYLEPDRPRKSSAVNQTQGYVYLIQSTSGYFKIGKAKDVQNRLKTFEVKLPFEVDLLHSIECDNYNQAESQLHERFKTKRVKGEWFNLTPDDVNYIKSIERM
jgi:hypothetical protein